MRAQSDNWSMMSYPITSNKDNKSYISSSGFEKNSNIEENDDYSNDGKMMAHNDQDEMPAPPKRKRKKYPNPGKTSRKRKRKLYKRDISGKFISNKQKKSKLSENDQADEEEKHMKVSTQSCSSSHGSDQKSEKI